MHRSTIFKETKNVTIHSLTAHISHPTLGAFSSQTLPLAFNIRSSPSYLSLEARRCIRGSYVIKYRGASSLDKIKTKVRENTLSALSHAKLKEESFLAKKHASSFKIQYCEEVTKLK